MTTNVAPKIKGPASYFPSIEKTYGEPVSHWMAVLKQAGRLTHMELVNLLKSKHKLGHGHANALVAHFLALDHTATHDPAAVARSAYEAYVSKDRAAIEALIADDFHFTSPLDNRLDRTAYFARCWPNSKTTEGFDFIHLVPYGDQVFVTYEARGLGARRFRNTEIVTVRRGQIVEIEVYFGWDLPHKAALGGFVTDANE